jgi:hypothetical protein
MYGSRALYANGNGGNLCPELVPDVLLRAETVFLSDFDVPGTHAERTPNPTKLKNPLLCIICIFFYLFS